MMDAPDDENTAEQEEHVPMQMPQSRRKRWVEITVMAVMVVCGFMGAAGRTKHRMHRSLAVNMVASPTINLKSNLHPVSTGRSATNSKELHPVSNNATHNKEHHPRREKQEKRRHLRHNGKHRELNLLQRDFVDCSKYQYTLSITDNLRINYVLNVNDNASGGGTISVEMVYLGVGWLGFAHSENGRMLGSTAVIGLPNSPSTAYQVQKYKLGGMDAGSIQPLLPDYQTLINATMEQTEYHTIMRFTKRLVEPGELIIHPNLQNNFLFAHGSSNELGFHATRGVAVLDLKPCIASVVPVDDTVGANAFGEKRRYDTGSYVIEIGSSSGGSSPVDVGGSQEVLLDELVDEGVVESSFTADQSVEDNISQPFPTIDDDVLGNDTLSDADTNSKQGTSASQKKTSRIWWTLHGVFATLTCVFLPIAIGSSLLRGCCGAGRKRQPSNNSLYRWSNILLVFVVTATFATAVIGAQHDNANSTRLESQVAESIKPETYHSPAGLALFIVMVFFSLIGSLRSFLAWNLPNPTRSREERKSGPSDFNSEDVSSMDYSMAIFATHWDRSYCIAGAILVGLTFWECQNGFDLFESRFHGSWFTRTLFWGISGTSIGVVGFLCLLQLCYLALQYRYKLAYW